MMNPVLVVEEMELMTNGGIIHADPEDSKRLNDLMREVADEIIKQITKEHDKHFPLTKFKHDPVIIAVNAYALAMNFVIALNKQVLGLCLDMQANYNQALSEEGHGNS